MRRNDKLGIDIDLLIKKSSEKALRFYGVKLKYPVTPVYSLFGVVASGLFPWAVSGIRKTIIVRYPYITQKQLIHEMSHWTLKKLTNLPIPLWFDEGLACYLSDMNFVKSKRELNKLIGGRVVLDISSLVGFWGKVRWVFEMYLRNNTKLIYGISYYMVVGLIDQYGVEKIKNFVRRLKTTGFNAAFKKTYLISVKDYYDKFVVSIS